MGFELKFVKAVLAGPALATAILLTGCGDITTKSSATPSSPSGSSADSFLKEAANGNMAEVQMGRLAASKSQNPDVVNFGKSMIDDHSANLLKVKELAAQKSVTLPPDVDDNDKTEMSKMEALSGAAFDRAYVKAMVEDHKKDVAAFEKAANTVADTAVKNYAAETLPTLQHHLKMAQDAEAKVNGKVAPQASNDSTNPSNMTPTPTSVPETDRSK